MLVGQGVATPAATRAAGPSVAITDPVPGATVLAGSGFRLGWTESAPTGAPIVRRTLATYSGPSPEGGDCWGARTMLVSTDDGAAAPHASLVTGLEPGTCTYWVVEVVDVEGRSSKARSGYVRRPPLDEPHVSLVFPVPGAASEVPPLATVTVRWGETSAAGVTERTVIEQSAPLTAARSCAGAAWRVSRVFVATGDSLEVDGLTDDSCYRYIVAVADANGRGATVVSGVLLVTTVPPPCAYGDVEAASADTADWSGILLDTTQRLPVDYVPLDLVRTRGIAKVNARFRIRSVAYADLKALADAARAAGATIDLTSAYRTDAQQKATYEYYVGALGPADGLLRAARPGHSEHQLGTAIDVKAYNGVSPSNYSDWTVTKAGAWMRDKAWRYGWVMSYPKASSPARTCYQYEPWHYRYVGRMVAKAVHDSGLTLREYLWRQGSLAPGT